MTMICMRNNLQHDLSLGCICFLWTRGESIFGGRFGGGVNENFMDLPTFFRMVSGDINGDVLCREDPYSS
jgi:hypothetical protein